MLVEFRKNFERLLILLEMPKELFSELTAIKEKMGIGWGDEKNDEEKSGRFLPEDYIGETGIPPTYQRPIIRQV